MRILNLKNTRAFTLMEAMVTVIIVGTLASSAIVGYGKTLTYGAERGVITDLMTITSAEKMYFAKHGSHWPTSTENIASINATLGLNITEPSKIAYTCTTTGSATPPDCQASYDGGQWILSTYSTAPGFKFQPYCLSGSCPSCHSATDGSCY